MKLVEIIVSCNRLINIFFPDMKHDKYRDLYTMYISMRFK